jgi:hypothetical protein
MGRFREKTKKANNISFIDMLARPKRFELLPPRFMACSRAIIAWLSRRGELDPSKTCQAAWVETIAKNSDR